MLREHPCAHGRQTKQGEQKVPVGDAKTVSPEVSVAAGKQDGGAGDFRGPEPWRHSSACGCFREIGETERDERYRGDGDDAPFSRSAGFYKDEGDGDRLPNKPAPCENSFRRRRARGSPRFERRLSCGSRSQTVGGGLDVNISNICAFWGDVFFEKANKIVFCYGR